MLSYSLRARLYVFVSTYYRRIVTLSHRRIVALLLSCCHIVAMSYRRIVALLLSCCYIVAMSYRRIIVLLLSYCHIVALSRCCRVAISSYYRIVVLSDCRIVALSYYHIVALSLWYFYVVHAFCRRAKAFCPYVKTHFARISIVILLVYNNSQFNFIKITLSKSRISYRTYR